MRVEPAIEISGLTKRYGAKTAVDNLSLTVFKGEIFALLGPNGAGKTTTILMLMGLSSPDDGQRLVLGLDPGKRPLEVKKQVGYLPENVGFYGDLNASENLSFVAALNGLDGAALKTAVDKALETVELSAAAGQKLKTFSRGMRQRLGLAEVLLKSPRLLFLDEPTLGLDPDGIEKMLSLIVGLAEREGITVVISSHLLPLVEKVAHRVAILRNGRLLAEGSVAALAAEKGLQPGLETVYRHYFNLP